MRALMNCSFCDTNKESIYDIYNSNRSKRMCLDCRTAAALLIAVNNGHSPIIPVQKYDCIITPDYICSRCNASFGTGADNGLPFGGSLLNGKCYIKDDSKV